ncbi:carbohydrate kinase family protein [Candidatus Peregrinibacteria bacterium]|jgi:adenosine kinase|nr:carbohydrate kinase family protein [Candidatus Peregrinibacteria bacterium]MBT7736296.1 carbohydrate kinase family protein [Candidatus Peregrinibacteria bacterium]
MKSIILTGSIAFDHLMKYKGSFKDSILENELDHLSVSFMAPNREMFFGGCSPNVAHALNLLEEDPVIVGVAGHDFGDYKKFLEQSGIDTRCIQISQSDPTAAAFILTDYGQNQIAIFSPGAMANLDLCMDLCGCKKVDNAFCALISPDIPERMVALAQTCIDRNIPYVFDPGQAIAGLDPESLSLIIDCCWGMVANEYEAELLEEKLDLSAHQIANKSGFLVITKGREGCEIHKEGVRESVMSVPNLDVVDVTGAGDAFRAGLLHGLNSGKNLKRSCEIANVVASFSVVVQGTQTYSFSKKDINDRLDEFYG